MKKISQREARRMRAELQKMKDDEACRFNGWMTGYPGGIHIRSLSVDAETALILKTARRLNHALVATTNSNDSSVYFYAIPPRNA